MRGVFAGFPSEQVDAAFEELFAYYGRGEAWNVFPDAKPALEALQSREVLLGIVSNFDARLFHICEELGLAGLFRTVVVSSRVGAAKPQAEIFRHALRNLGVSPLEALHVGDSWREDVRGAEAAGMRALCIDRRNAPPGPCIADLRVLPERLVL
ncbi:MAG: hypothetical protein KatS3mg082_3105 [Nitrospiraceae bacterium]|nr:MAG: hypothetical protein KatS3mg082_3105 [Nitrospiraceae bacterium]